MADVKSLSSILKDVNKKYGDSVMAVGVDDLRSFDTLSLGSPGLDFCLYNSCPTRRIFI